MKGNYPGFWTVVRLWICYFLPFLPIVPRIGNPEEADCLFVQAFGRNEFDDRSLGKVLWDVRSQAGMDDVEAFNMLVYRSFNPGKPNRALARVAMRLSDWLSIPVIAQWEVVFAIFQMAPEWYFANRGRIDSIWPGKEGYFATHHVKVFSREKMLGRGLSRPLEVAHPSMVARAVPVIWKLGMNPIVQGMSLWKFWTHELWIWDKESVQLWTRSFALWLLREIPGRAHHVAFGYVALRPS